MLIGFEQLPNAAKIWIYQSKRPFSNAEKVWLNDILTSFVGEWTAHDQSLEAGFQIVLDHFIVLGVNQNHHAASGCSIDKSVHVMQTIGKKLDVDLFDRFNIAYFDAQKQIKTADKHTFQSLIDDKSVDLQTIVVNNLILTKGDLSEQWIVAAEKSWHKRVFRFSINA